MVALVVQGLRQALGAAGEELSLHQQPLKMLKHREGLRRHRGIVRPPPFALPVDVDPDVLGDKSHPLRCRSTQFLPTQPDQTRGAPWGSVLRGEAQLPHPPFAYGR